MFIRKNDVNSPPDEFASNRSSIEELNVIIELKQLFTAEYDCEHKQSIAAI